MAGGSGAPKQYGITKPLSLLGPVEADLQRTSELEKVCNCFSFMSAVRSVLVFTICRIYILKFLIVIKLFLLSFLIAVLG
jgi:hypothetical protein